MPIATHSRFTFRITLLLLLVILAPACQDRVPSGAGGFQAEVVSITDGDTIVVLRGQTQVKVRLYGIDCPERRQGFYRRAREFTADLAADKTVRVIERGVDTFGRTVGEVILPDGRSLNQEVVRAGLAWWYKRYAPNYEELARLEREAREKKLGLWRDPRPIPPWGFRRR